AAFALKSDEEKNTFKRRFQEKKIHQEIVDFIFEDKNLFQILVKVSKDLFDACVAEEKDLNRAQSARINGNELFKSKDYKSAILKYSEAILYSPSFQNSTTFKEHLALSYGNRSATLFHSSKYSEAIVDIDEALQNGYPLERQFILFHRKNRCLKYLQMYQKEEQCTRSSADSINCENMNNQIPIHLKQPMIQTAIGENGYEMPKVNIKSNELIKQASDAVEMKFTVQKGRYICAKRNIESGEVVMIEKAFASWLKPSLYTKYCTHCFHPVDIIFFPCPNCISVRFCSVTCRKEALKQYHLVECPVLSSLKRLSNGHLALRIIMKAGIQNALNMINKPEIPLEKWLSTNFDTNYESLYSLPDHIENRQYENLCPDANGAVFLALFAHKMKLIDGNNIRKLAALLLKHISQIECNVMSIAKEKVNFTGTMGRKRYFPQTEELGFGIYPTICLLNHSCDPNVINSFSDIYAISTVVEDVAKGEELNVTYGPHHKRMSYKDRQAVLM
ncbi:SET and MYND domain-containing protein 4-like protein, partial [Dinothrombium tinctorium]